MTHQYHPKLLKAFDERELDQIIRTSSYSIDKEGYIKAIFVWTDKLIAEIYADYNCRGKALIANLKQDSPEEYIDKQVFWDLFQESDPESLDCPVQ